MRQIRQVSADYDGRAVEASRRVLLELVRVLGTYDEEMAIVGGWVPSLVFSNSIREVRPTIVYARTPSSGFTFSSRLQVPRGE